MIPSKLRTQVLVLAHEGHPGIVSMKQRLRSKVWWSGIDRQAERFCKTCHGCQLVSRPANPEPIKPTLSPRGPWQDLAVDLLGPLPSEDYVFSRSRLLQQILWNWGNAVHNIWEDYWTFRGDLTTHGLPLSVASDNGPQFCSDVFERYLEDCVVEHLKTTPIWPQANGEVERQNRSLLKRMRIARMKCASTSLHIGRPRIPKRGWAQPNCCLGEKCKQNCKNWGRKS